MHGFVLSTIKEYGEEQIRNWPSRGFNIEGKYFKERKWFVVCYKCFNGSKRDSDR